MRTKGLIKKTFLVIGVLSFLILPALALAATNISVSIPGNNPNTGNASPGAFIANFYQFALVLGGILAFGVVVFGGVKYAASAGNSSAQSDAKEWIWGALLGLLLLGGAYFILKVVNPQLVNLNLPTLNQVASGGGGGTPPTNNTTTPPTSTSTCPIPALTPITDPQAQQMENGQTVIWNSSDAAVQANLTALQTAYGKFQTAIASVGDSGSLNSAYRPLAYQQHFYNIYQNATQYGIYASQSSNNYSNVASCAPIISALEAEETKHGICRTQSQCLVAKPSNCSPHVAGIGMDFKLSGPVSYAALNTTLSQRGVGIQWQALGASDPVHFQLISPPSGKCPS